MATYLIQLVSDGVPFSGDEALAPTGYFFTYNFLEANQVFSGVFDAVLGATGDLQAHLQLRLIR